MARIFRQIVVTNFPKRTRFSYPFIVSARLGGVINLTPFKPSDWPNPKSSKYLQLGFVNVTDHWMLDTLFVCGTYEWPNPTLIKRVIPDQAPYNKNLLSVTTAPIPFYLTNWPNPNLFY